MDQPIISVSGLRGVIGRGLDPLLAVRYAAAFALQADPGAVVVGRDGRGTGNLVAKAVISSLLACGRDVMYADVSATPTVGVLVTEHAAAGGIQITASHNPAEYNGIKLFGSDGRVLSAAIGRKVQQHMDGTAIDWATHDRIGFLRRLEDTTSAHLARVLATVDAGRIRGRQFRVLLDSNHGAGSVLGRELLAHLGADVTFLGDHPDGRFEHSPEPTATNLAGVADTVKTLGVDVGFCQDPDADRLAIIDETGRYIGEEYTLAITLHHALAQQPGPVVVNCATSRMARDIAERHQCAFHLSAVGEANVADKMHEVGAVYGGEGNGGPIDPRVGYVRDSFVGIAQVLDFLAAGSEPLSRRIAGFPNYSIVKSHAAVDPGQLGRAYERLVERLRPEQLSNLDGLWLDWPDKWLLVRGSNTEPIVRVIAEAPTGAEAERLCQAAFEELPRAI